MALSLRAHGHTMRDGVVLDVKLHICGNLSRLPLSLHGAFHRALIVATILGR